MRFKLFIWIQKLLSAPGKGKPRKDKLAAPPSEPRRSREFKKEAILLNVGLDYGTSSTKVVVRDILKSKSILLYLDQPQDGLPRFALPSVVTIEDGKLYFGAQGERLAGGRKMRSLKVCLACQMALVSCRGCDPQKAHHSLADGTFEVLLSTESVLTIRAESLVVAYLAFVMKRVYAWIERQYPEVEKSITFNVSAPLDQLDITEAELKYNYLFYLAEKLCRVIEQGLPLQKWHGYYEGAKRLFRHLPEPGDRNVFVQPETVAAVMPYTRSVQAEEGLYAIVDVGAGTTDVSFFRLGSFLPRQLSFYFAKTHPVGGDNIDSEILTWVRNALAREGLTDIEPHLAQMLLSIRSSKHKLANQGEFQLTVDDRQALVKGSDINEICSRSLKSTYTTYEKAWIGAYKKEERMNRWRNYSILFLGGGARLKSIREHLKKPPREFIEKVDTIDVIPRDEIVVLDPKLEADVRNNLDFLCVAYGLSFPQPEFHQVRFPRQVQALERDVAILEMPDHEELYPR